VPSPQPALLVSAPRPLAAAPAWALWRMRRGQEAAKAATSETRCYPNHVHSDMLCQFWTGLAIPKIASIQERIPCGGGCERVAQAILRHFCSAVLC
jgi:hypothetical protein